MIIYSFNSCILFILQLLNDGYSYIDFAFDICQTNKYSLCLGLFTIVLVLLYCWIVANYLLIENDWA